MKTILDSLLIELEQAYKKYAIKKYCLKYDHEWHYSLLTTTMKSDGPLVLGFNCGASQGEKYEPQCSVNESEFYSGDIGSLSRILPYCEKYFDIDFLSKISQSNYCFFRSEYESQISNNDIELCEPIFEKLIGVIKPSFILCFSSKLRDYLYKNNKIESSHSRKIQFQRGSSYGTYEAISAKLKSGIEIKFLPHPNYQIQGKARSEAWEFCCNNG